ncbi:MAG TPA: tRNA uridine-5-carboxymethylaminomethyl(34) synthesis GTPase MnmE, partial [Clostridia bacterium]
MTMACPLHRFPTVAAVATPPGVGALAIVRLTGEDSAVIADRIFRPANAISGAVSAMAPYTCRFGRILDPADGTVIDEVVLSRFAAPHSYTGEDMVEISCHGGAAVKRRILDALLACGAVAAGPGEFSRRAFLNGKMDLSQAEAVMDLISASAARTARAAAAQLGGALSRRVREFAEELYLLLGRLEMSIEYPEHEESGSVPDGIAQDIGRLAHRLAALCATHAQGRMLREGMTVVIAGRPNVGKSSLLNRLAGFDRAIVTEIAGTTRDTVEEIVDVDGLPVRLIDTAGLRETADQIERLGVDRSRDAIGRADLVLYVSSPEDENIGEPGIEADRETICAVARQVRLILVAGKNDRSGSREYADALRGRLGPDAPDVLPFSAVTGEGLDGIRAAIRAVYEEAGATDGDDVLLLNARHARCAADALTALEQARDALAAGAGGRPALPPDMISTILRDAAESLAAITGDVVSDRIVDTI